MTIDNNKVVSLHYKLSNHKTGAHIEETSEAHPMEFLFGVERLIPTFEVNIHGLKVGDTFEFSIPTAEAYGEISDEEIANVPVSVFYDENGKIDDTILKVDAQIPMSDNEGNRMMGVVKEFNSDYVVMDFNHPLAGIDLLFKGSIVSVREATKDELDHGHSHGEHGHHHH